MSAAEKYQFNLPKKGKPKDVMIPEVWYPGVQKYWENCTSRRSVDPIFGITTIVIHATAGNSSAGAVSVMKKKIEAASFHWLVPDEDEEQHGLVIWACAPEARAAWHVRNGAFHADVNGGAKRVNHWSLGIEVVNSQKSSDSFSLWQVEATAKIVRYCWSKYPNLIHIVSHAKLDPSRRSDPGENFPWKQFKENVFSSEDDGLQDVVAEVESISKLKHKNNGNSCCMA